MPNSIVYQPIFPVIKEDVVAVSGCASALGKYRKRYEQQIHQKCSLYEFKEFVWDYSYGPLPVISTYNPIYRMYNPMSNQL